MKIVPIFANKLFAFHYPEYPDDDKNEYDRNIELWTNVGYLRAFAKKYVSGIDINQYVKNRLEDAEQIIDLVEDLSLDNTKSLDQFFQSFHDSESPFVTLSLQKGKTKHFKRSNYLRFYAIRIDTNCFVITGGAIKASQAIDQNALSKLELPKLQKCKDFLTQNGVFDADSFFELLLEQQ